MKVDDRNKLLEVVDVLRALGGNNGFANLQPKVKRMLLGYANDLKKIVDDDVAGNGYSLVEKMQMSEKDKTLMTY